MKFGVVIFPGSNCDQDMIHVLGQVMQCPVKPLWHKDTSLEDLGKDDCIILPGGFSFGDYLRTGAIARFSPVMENVIRFANDGGYVWGICNGFQVLCEAGLLPGALLRNDHQRFLCQNQYIVPVTQNSAITHLCTPGKALKVPIAHGDGRYYADDNTLAELEANDQILFRYCDADGTAELNSNPNGSVRNIAGICNKKRNVFGMMPHPERASEEILGNTDGKKLFESIVSYTAITV